MAMIPVDEIKRQVRDAYGRRAQGGCCGGSSCCAPEADARDVEEEIAEFVGPSLGCGSPLAFAEVRAGEVVLDLGSGAGREVLEAARRTGPSGRAIGIDMTPEMIWKARANAERAGITNAEFRLGEIEQMPVADASVDVAISNCVINLVPDKTKAFSEVYRVLKPGGRIVISDIVSHGPLPEGIRRMPGAWAACVAGAEEQEQYLKMIGAAGFQDVEVLTSEPAVFGKVQSVTVRARKPEVSSS